MQVMAPALASVVPLFPKGSEWITFHSYTGQVSCNRQFVSATYYMRGFAR